jgi:NADH:ubiquinone oxidoreductase subunit K
MIPITHFTSLAFFLFAAGLGGALLRRDRLGGIIGVPIMLSGAALVGVAYARYWGNHEGQLLAGLAVGGAVSIVAVGLAIHRRLSEPRDEERRE